MSNRVFLCLIFLIFTACKTKTGKIKNRPNVIILHADDLGYHDLSFTGSKIYQTPHIDSLAHASVNFTNAYANYPRCVPSRYAMITGNYPIQNGDVPDDGFHLQPKENSKSYIQQITDAGYQTAYFGKWHLGKDPKELGFQTSFAAGEAGSPINYFFPFNKVKHPWQAKKSPVPDVDEKGREGDYLTDLLTESFIEYLEKADKNKPVMAMLAFYAVHQPLESKKEDVLRNREEIKNHDFGNLPEYIKEGTGRTKMRQDQPVYAGMVENLDENIGKILKALKKLGMDENTIIIFSSDHGGLSNDGYKQRQLATSNFPLRAGKGWLYEGGIKIPFFLNWDKIQPREEESLVLLMDVFPTINKLINPKSESTGAGKSMLPVIHQQEEWDARTVFWHSSKARPQNTGDSKSSAIRKGKYKLIHWYEKEIVELYNLQQDPSEQNNMIEEQPELAKDLLNELTTWKSNF